MVPKFDSFGNTNFSIIDLQGWNSIIQFLETSKSTVTIDNLPQTRAKNLKQQFFFKYHNLNFLWKKVGTFLNNAF
jgi:hypothetical protein